MTEAPPLVDTAWLGERLGASRIKVVDATFFLPGQGDAEAQFRNEHIPGAVFFDVDKVADTNTGLPHMIPEPAAFAEAVGRMGIGDEDHVIAYGVAAARVWWHFRTMGHDLVSVLDGGLARWKAEHRPTESGETRAQRAVFHARPRPELVRSFEALRAELESGGRVLDARPAERFRGEAPEPRPGLKGGHMPGAYSLPSSTLFTPGGTLRSPDELRLLLQAVGADVEGPVTATCGSGVTACMIALARARLGQWDTAVYDGSWAEWGARDDAPVATGSA